MNGRLWLPGLPRLWTPPPVPPARRWGPEWGDPPYDWPGLDRRPPLRLAPALDVQSGNTVNIGSSVSTATMTWTNKPTAGTKVIVVSWAWQSGGGGADNLTSIVDNSTGGNITLTKVVTIANSVIRIYIHFADNVQPPAGSYALTFTYSASQTKIEATGCSYTGVASGAASATKTNTGAGTSETTGAFGSGSDAIAIAGTFNDTGTNGAPTAGGGFTIRGTESNGAANVVGGMADDIAAGSYSPSFTTAGSGNWAAVGASWAAAAGAAVAGQVLYAYGAN